MHFKNPIFEMELKLKMKNVSVPVIIMLYNVFFALISIVSLISFSDLDSAGLDNAFLDLISVFFFLGVLQCIFLFFLAPVCTASSIAGERERGTLDLLLVSPLRPVQIVLGKLLANMFILLLPSISSMPILSVGFILGGIRFKEIAVFFFTLILIAFFCSSIGIYCSSVTNKRIKAFLFSFLLEFLFTIGNLYFILLVENMKSFAKVAGYLLVLNPLVSIIWLYDKMTGANNMMYVFIEFFKIDQTSQLYVVLPRVFFPICVLVQILIGVGFIYLSVRSMVRRYRSFK